MFTKNETESQLDAEIRSALTELKLLEKTSEDYGTLVERISKLHKLKTEERSRQISTDTALNVAANIFAILVIVNHERAGVITSKALGFVSFRNR